MTHSLSRCKNINYLKAVESQPPITSGPNQAKYVTGLNFTTFVSFLFIIYNNIFISTKPSFMFLKQNFGSNYSEKLSSSGPGPGPGLIINSELKKGPELTL